MGLAKESGGSHISTTNLAWPVSHTMIVYYGIRYFDCVFRVGGGHSPMKKKIVSHSFQIFCHQDFKIPQYTQNTTVYPKYRSIPYFHKPKPKPTTNLPPIIISS